MHSIHGISVFGRDDVLEVVKQISFDCQSGNVLGESAECNLSILVRLLTLWIRFVTL